MKKENIMGRKEQLKEIKTKLQKKYSHNKSSVIHETCICPICGKKFVKKTKAQAFCGSRTNVICKDTYWNFMRYDTLPFPLIGDFKVLEITKKEIEEMVGDGSDETEEEKKFTDMLVESIDLGNEEKKEFDTDRTDLWDDNHPWCYEENPPEEQPFDDWRNPEDDYFI